MRRRDFETLEFPAVLASVARFARSEAGREGVRGLRPLTEVGAVDARLDRVEEMLERTARHGAPPTADVVRLAPMIVAATPEGAALEARELAALRDLLEVARHVRVWLQRDAESTPRLATVGTDLGGGRGLAGSLNRALDARGLIRDDASPALERARALLRDLRAQVESRLMRLVRDPDLRHVIGDDYVTLRNNRFVVPVRASQPNAIPGVVQDRSGSDETIFVEPLFAVELNNRLLLAANDAEVEERRVRSELTGLVRDEAAVLVGVEEALATIDTLAAAAAFAVEHRCTRPRVGGAAIALRGARHPLLLTVGRTAVPVDILLRDDQRGLAISGPNAGGKTVALKTLGLCALMAQSGLYVPADDGATLPCCSSVLADIGDEQSIAQDLSTFTAHAENLAAIATATGADGLVLLDEPGAGTDPTEGAALAIGVLTDLLERGARVAFTTHFAHVKTFALGDQRLEVAAFDVDPVTGAPTFRLTYRTIGRSFALPIARRHGVPVRAIEIAERHLAGESQDLSRAVGRLEETRRTFEEAREALATERAALERERAEAEGLAADLRARKRQSWSEELEEARRFVRGLRTRGETLLDELRQRPSSEALRGFVRDAQGAIAEREPDTPAPPPPSRPLRLGDHVEVVGRGIQGELVEISGPRARLQRGGLRFEVATDQLRLVGGGAPPPPRERVAVYVERPVEEEGLDRIDLTGQRTRDAVDALAAFVDRAVRAGVPEVRIIHGIGGGALKKAVQEWLAASRYCIARHEAEPNAGGAGVTIARLA